MKNLKSATAFILIFTSCIITAQAQYCNVSPSPNCTGAVYISNVHLVGNTLAINNTTGCDNYSNPGAVADLSRGSTYSMDVTLQNVSASQLRIFIDYDGNQDFCGSGELVYNYFDSGTGTYTESFSFTVPLGATIGVTRMRVMADWLGGLPSDLFDACGGNNTSCNAGSSTAAFSGYGEVEDYAINITSEPNALGAIGVSSLSFTVNPNPVVDNIYLTITGVIEVAVRIEILDLTGSIIYSKSIRQVKGANSQIAIPFDKYAEGIYYCRLTTGNETRIIKIVRISG